MFALNTYLLVAEKPSLLKSIRDCYNNHKSEIQQKVGSIDFIALSGHMCRNGEPDEYPQWAGLKWRELTYPIIPQQWSVLPAKDKRKQDTLNELKQRADSVDGIIVATDSDTEGYGIWLLIEQYLGLRNKPTLRFMEHSLTDGEILQSLLTMTDFYQDPVHTRACCSYLIRSRADWLYGMNITRVMSVKTGELLRIGRVKAPTIKLIYDNSMAIENFQEKIYYQVQADYGTFTSVLSDNDLKPIKFEPGQPTGEYPPEGTVVSCDTKRETTHAPKLFDLSSAQAESGRLFGYKPDRTLELIQTLYEKYKVISYPRTQCRYVSSEKAREFPSLLKVICVYPDLAEYVKTLTSDGIHAIMKDKQVVNDKEVQKESHDALLPTSTPADPSRMTEEENNICHMIYARLLCQFLPRAEDDKTKMVIRHGNGLFVANGRAVVKPGWRVLDKTPQDNILEKHNPGDVIVAKEIKPVEKKTTPPKRLTQATLVNAMQNIANSIEDEELKKSLADSKGIGTPATRASIISDIITTGYAEDKRGGLYITDLGKTYVKSLEQFDIMKPEFAAVMDTDIKRVQRGEAEYNAVYTSVLDKLNAMCAQMNALPQTSGEKPTDKLCPKCGKTNLISRRYSYTCKECGFNLNKNIAGAEITDEVLDTLLSGGVTRKFSMKNKKGTKFTASLYLDADKNLAFDFTSGITCPNCKTENITMNRGGVFCPNENCGFHVYRKQFGSTLTDAQLTKLVTKGITDKLKFKSKNTGKQYYGKVALGGPYGTQMVFDNNKGKGKGGNKKEKEKINSNVDENDNTGVNREDYNNDGQNDYGPNAQDQNGCVPRPGYSPW